MQVGRIASCEVYASCCEAIELDLNKLLDKLKGKGFDDAAS